MKVYKLTKKCIPILLSIETICLFFFNTYIRDSVNHNLKFIEISYFLFLPIIFFLLRKNINLKYLFAFLYLFAQGILNYILVGYSVNISYIGNSLLLALLIFDYKRINLDYKKACQVIIKTINFITFCLLIFWLVDCMFDGLAIKSLASNFTTYSIYTHLNFGFFSYRFASLMGQALANKSIFLIFLVLNTTYYIKTGEKILNQYLIYLISICGCLMTASKTGIILSLIFILISLFYQKKFGAKMLVFLSLILLFYAFGAFDLVLNRLFNTELSSGRTTVILTAKNMDLLHVHLFYGTGVNLIESYNWDSYHVQVINEFPFVSIVLKNGIVYSIILLYLLSDQMLKKCIHDKNLFQILAFIIILIDFNTYNNFMSNTSMTLLWIITIVSLLWINNIKTNLVRGKR